MNKFLPSFGESFSTNFINFYIPEQANAIHPTVSSKLTSLHHHRVSTIDFATVSQHKFRITRKQTMARITRISDPTNPTICYKIHSSITPDNWKSLATAIYQYTSPRQAGRIERVGEDERKVVDPCRDNVSISVVSAVETVQWGLLDK